MASRPDLLQTHLLPPMNDSTRPVTILPDRVVLENDYAASAWARHFNVSESRVKEAVSAVGDHADRVREHLERNSERPSA
ncbi:MAG: DUF3606 domain-containing protein [Burkholderiales bacterium]|nr:MAG: DUF3606 domain-containing protein [Burkholderiales bacterium]